MLLWHVLCDCLRHSRKSAHTHFRLCPALLLLMCAQSLNLLFLTIETKAREFYISFDTIFVLKRKKIRVIIDYLKNKHFKYTQGRRVYTVNISGETLHICNFRPSFVTICHNVQLFFSLLLNNCVISLYLLLPSGDTVKKVQNKIPFDFKFLSSDTMYSI